MEKIKLPGKPDYTRIYAAAVFVVLLYYLVKHVNEGLWYAIYCVYYLYLIPVLIAFSLYFKSFRKPLEVKLFILYWLWVYISRLLNGDYFLTFDGAIVLDIGLGCVFLTACVALSAKDRICFLDWMSIAVSGYFTLVGLAAMYGVILQRELRNPLFYGELMGFEDRMYRLTVFGKSSNECVMWFFISFFLLIYLFVRKKNLLWRIALTLAGAVNYLCLTMTFSRNGRVAFSIGVALLAALWAMKRRPLKKMSAKILVTAAVVCVVLPVVYLGFNTAAKGVSLVSNFAVAAVGGNDLQEVQTDSGEGESAGETPADTSLMYQDERGLKDSGRLDIYKSIIPTMQKEPLRLLRGCLNQEIMSVANTVLVKHKAHFHNTFLQVLSFTGLPGFMLSLAFCLLLPL